MTMLPPIVGLLKISFLLSTRILIFTAGQSVGELAYQLVDKKDHLL